jgi:hypothetical protein
MSTASNILKEKDGKSNNKHGQQHPIPADSSTNTGQTRILANETYTLARR